MARRQLIAVADGYRESEQSWKELLLDVKAVAWRSSTSLAIGDGALGSGRRCVMSGTRTKEQRCWVHKMANILDKLPRAAAEGQGGVAWIYGGGGRRPRAREGVGVVREDIPCQVSEGDGVPGEGQGGAPAFYEFRRALGAYPDHHPIESVFSTVRLRHDKTKGAGAVMRA